MSFGVACLLAKETFTFFYLMLNFRPYFSLHDGGVASPRPFLNLNLFFWGCMPVLLEMLNFRPYLVKMYKFT